MKQLIPLGAIILAILFGVSFHAPQPAHAGEPTGEIGPMNPTRFKCVEDTRIVPLQFDPFQKLTIDVLDDDGELIPLPTINEFLAENPNAQQNMCVDTTDYDWNFDPTDAAQFEAYLDDLERECDEFDGSIQPITNTTVEGFVYEFHPENPADPENSEWFAVPSKDVSVRIDGITFEAFWGTDDNGFYYFNNLGAGPITVNLQLPPDATAINPDVVVFSTGGELFVDANEVTEITEVWTVQMGFYRGEVGPPDVFQLRTPGGTPLPFLTLADIENMSQCGYDDLPSINELFDIYQLPPPTEAELAELPDVGGVPEQETPLTTIAMAVLVLLALPLTGGLTLYYTWQANRRKKQEGETA